jgi:hypothetical protein
MICMEKTQVTLQYLEHDLPEMYSNVVPCTLHILINFFFDTGIILIKFYFLNM